MADLANILLMLFAKKHTASARKKIMFRDEDIWENYEQQTKPPEHMICTYDSPFQYFERRGRKRKYETNADRQKAYRNRKNRYKKTSTDEGCSLGSE